MCVYPVGKTSGFGFTYPRFESHSMAGVRPVLGRVSLSTLLFSHYYHTLFEP